MYSTAAKNIMLDAFGAAADFMSLHDGYPGDNGANEIAGGAPAYARKSHTWNAAAGATKDDSNAPVFDVPAGTEAQFVGFWDAVTVGTYLGCAPLGGGTPLKFTVDATNNTIESLAHGLANGDKVVFFRGAAPGGLTEGVIYFVVNATTDDFQVSATQGGAAIDLTSQAAASCRVSEIVPETFASQGTLTVTDTDVDLLD